MCGLLVMSCMLCFLGIHYHAFRKVFSFLNHFFGNVSIKLLFFYKKTEIREWANFKFITRKKLIVLDFFYCFNYDRLTICLFFQFFSQSHNFLVQFNSHILLFFNLNLEFQFESFYMGVLRCQNKTKKSMLD